MSDDIAEQILAEIKESKFGFAIQLDELTDITNYCQLLVFVRYAQTNIQWTPLNVITDNVINRLIISEFLITARTYNIYYKYAAYCNQYIGYCYQYFRKRSD